MPSDLINKEFERWLNNVEPEDKVKLHELKSNKSLIEFSFEKDIEFGTGGLRSLYKLGPNCINIYTVRRATQGLSDYLNQIYKSPSVVIAKDSRHGGKEFEKAIVEVLISNNIRVYIFNNIEPTPLLSYAVRYLHCSAGICITASHNPSEYNGYKVYDEEGCQITSVAAKQIQGHIQEVDIFSGIKRTKVSHYENCDNVSYVAYKLIDQYLEEIIRNCPLDFSAKDYGKIHLTYSPLNGAGLECITHLFKKIGLENYCVVDEQKLPDGDFPSCKVPNPEKKEALELGIKCAKDNKSDVLIATDPDADRIGVAVYSRATNDFQILSGNEIGLLLLNFLSVLRKRSGMDLSSKIALSTIVSSDLAIDLAKAYGFELRRTLTGFKYIGEQICELEKNRHESNFLFAFEESHGYLAGTYARDKDGILATLLVCQMLIYYKGLGMDISTVLESIYQEYGYVVNKQISINLKSGNSDFVNQIFKHFKSFENASFAGFEVKRIVDYNLGAKMPVYNQSISLEYTSILPKSNVLQLNLDRKNKLILRPSGTEPKINFYITARGESKKEANDILDSIASALKKEIERYE